MTYWFHAHCVTCSEASPPLFVDFNGSVSLYPLDDAGRGRAGEWLAGHAAPGHDVRLVHENDGNTAGEPKFPGPDWGDESK